MMKPDKVISRGKSKRKEDGHCPTAQVIVGNTTRHLKKLRGVWSDDYGNTYEMGGTS